MVEPDQQPVMLNPTVSVIIPNYNHARFLPKRLDSVFNQTYKDFEVILLDDCSTDGSAELLRSCSDDARVSHCVVNTENSGSPFKQWRKGIELARGDYIWMAESDDWAETGFLETLMPHFSDMTGLVYCRSTVINEQDEAFKGDCFWSDGLDSQKWRTDYSNDGLQEIASSLVYRNTIPAASACIINKRRMGQFPAIDDFNYAGDWLFWVELLKNCRMYYCASSMNRHRLHSTTTRGFETGSNEVGRLREYSRVIDRARAVGRIRDRQSANYQWIFKEIYHHRTQLSASFWWPPLPSFLRPAYCSYIAGRLLRRLIEKLSSIVRLTGSPNNKQ